MTILTLKKLHNPLTDLLHSYQASRADSRSALERLDRIYQLDSAGLEERKKVYCQEELVGIAYCRGLGEA